MHKYIRVHHRANALGIRFAVHINKNCDIFNRAIMEFERIVIRRRDETKFVLDFDPKIQHGAAVPNDVVPANSVISEEPGKYFFVPAEPGSSIRKEPDSVFAQTRRGLIDLQ